MKKYLGLMITTLAFMAHPSFAGGGTQMVLNTSGNQDKHYFLCVYGAGCFNIEAANQISAIPIVPMDLGNVKKLVITDIRDMRMYMQPIDASCNLKVNEGQKVTIRSHLSIKNNKPVLTNVHCSLS